MADFTAKLQQLRQIAESFSWEESLCASVKEKESLDSLKIKEPKFRKIEVTFSAQQLILAPELPEFGPVTTVGMYLVPFVRFRP